MKKLILFILVLAISLSMTTGIFAAQADNETALLSKLDIMSGFPDGQFYPELNVTRAQFAKIAVQASPYKNMVAHGSFSSPFADVSFAHWAAPYIKTAASNKLVSGYPDSTFLPENNVTLAEAVTVMLKLLGYTDDDFGSSWPYGQMALARNLGILDNVSADINDALSRGLVRTLVCNTLHTNSKNSTSDYINSIGYSILEDITLIATNKENSSVGLDKVFTSGGTFEIDNTFNYGDVGFRGDALVKEGKLKLFIPGEQTKNSYIIYSTTSDDVVVYKGTELTALGLDKNTKTYYNLQETTLGNVLTSLDAGYGITVFTDVLGRISYAVITPGKINGPVTVLSLSQLDLLGSYSVFVRDGKKATKSDICVNDIIYYSSELGTVWSYSKKVSGIYEKATPNKDSVSSVVVSGTTYQLETATAMSKVSSGGAFELGDYITLLLGKDGKVADVITPSAANETTYGVLTDSGKKEFTDVNSNTTTSYYATLLLADGSSATYRTNKDYSSFKNKLVRLSVNKSVATVSKINTTNTVYGVLNASKMTLGTSKLALDVKILDLTTQEAYEPLAFASVFPSRLDGINLSASDILYSSKNDKGEIDTLFLNDKTGDAYSYGIVTKATALGNSGEYECVIGSSNQVIFSQNKKFLIESGQCAKFDLSGNTVTSITSLVQLSEKITDISAAHVICGGNKYLMSDKVVAYNSKYMLVPISDLIGNNNYLVTAYYDKHPSLGGRIRVLKVTEK